MPAGRRRGRRTTSGWFISGLRQVTALALAAALVLAQIPQALAKGLIRDAEIEAVIAEYSEPIFRAAGLGSQGIRIHLVNDETFNAFVVDGRNMFIHVGAILKTETPNQLIGIIAHEAGHIAGGHLSRLRQYIAKAQTAALMIQLLGIAAMAAGAASGGGGDLGEAGAAVLHGGSHALHRSILAYRRVEESAADQAAVSYLDRTKQSAAGMLQTFRVFADQSLASLRFVDPYVQSHPMPQDRIAQLRDLAQASPNFNKKDPPELQHKHDMIKAKLLAFVSKNNAPRIFRDYPENNKSLPARYARAIARYFAGGVKVAMPLIDELIATQPQNPYFYELKGQFLLESSEAAQAVPPLQKAVALAPNAGLIRIMLAQALLATNNKAAADDAVQHLRKALVQESHSALGYRQLASAYGRMNKIADAELAAAQAFFYEGKLKDAKAQAERARRKFPNGSPGWVKADDIINFEPPKQN